jgi:hypothetical protein
MGVVMDWVLPGEVCVGMIRSVEVNSIGVGVTVEVGVTVLVEVEVDTSVKVAVLDGGWEVESSALTGLTLNCRIGQKINMAISSNADENVSTTPRDNFVWDGWKSRSSINDLQSWRERMVDDPQ